MGDYAVIFLGDIPAGLVVEIDASEALVAVNAIRNAILVICVIAVGIVIVAGVLFSNSFKKPIVKLAAASAKIADGDLNVYVIWVI